MFIIIVLRYVHLYFNLGWIFDPNFTFTSKQIPWNIWHWRIPRNVPPRRFFGVNSRHTLSPKVPQKKPIGDFCNQTDAPTKASPGGYGPAKVSRPWRIWWVTRGKNPEMYPPGEMMPYPIWGKGTSSTQKWVLMGYLSFKESVYLYLYLFCVPVYVS